MLRYAALVLLTACSISDFTFHDPVAEAETQSCANLAKTCGAGQNEDCCASLPVPGGTYFRGYDVGGDNSSGNMSFPATVSAFRLDKFEVTVGRFRQFYNANEGNATSPPAAGAGAHAAIANSGWDPTWPLTADKAALNAALHCSPDGGGDLGGGTWYDNTQPGDSQTPPDSPLLGEARPVNCVTWYEAMAFCIWDGGYLPTEAEWGLAATTTEQRPYPWSDVKNDPLLIDPDHAEYSYPGDDTCHGGVNPTQCNVSDVLPVGSKPEGAGKYGHMDLAGNVDEWMLDATQDSHANRLTPCTDCAAVTPAPQRIFRGGSLAGAADKQRTGLILPDVPGDRQFFLGLRCARPALPGN